MELLLVVPVVVVGVAVAALAVGATRLVRPASERVRVSVDDLALGRLPPLCVKTGEPTDLRAEVEGSEGGFRRGGCCSCSSAPLASSPSPCCGPSAAVPTVSVVRCRVLEPP